MSAQRARRQNAGNKLATMVAEERAKIASGEAALSDDDDDFARRAGDDDDDIVESDFEETDSEAERAADATSRDAEAMVERVERRRQRKTARKRRVVPHFAGTAPRQPAESPVGAVQARAQKRPMLAVRVSSRTLAMRKALETEERTQERELKAKRRRRRDGAADTQPALTQELLLEEAKATEIENLEKLREFQAQAAEDKQRLIATRRAPLMVRPVAHWRSCAVAGEAVAATGAEPAQGPAARRAATDYVLEGLDELRFPLNPWARRRPALRPRTCPVTGLPARYVHPRTRIPYANARAYRILEDLAQGQHAYLYDIGVWSSAAFATPPHV
ncbi:hypothetical protein LPJ61_002693 [Coemansia biformis]|uniref:Vps72/YL1 C-terminal domain-containing protein n=1 Tax=Coemansia biformis TaxID=1286918 RepID=A0A9W7Y7W5_9FUNG|nr:hypothetical protein LPJ61_002693 [Coemansia biformis]